MNITINISPTVTREQQQDPRFQASLEATKRYFNSPDFRKKYRRLLCLHEAGHIVYARRAGATDVKFHGPTMYWCSGCPACPGDTPSVSKSMVSWTSPPDCGVTAELKSHIGGIVFRELSGEPNDEAGKWSDMKNAREWYQEHVGLDEKAFLQAVLDARKEIIQDLKSVEFQKLVSDTAEEFGRAIFPAPKVTAATLRARRLGW
jgi:hypothetical protein